MRFYLIMVALCLIRNVTMAQPNVDHGIFDLVLKEYVNEKGWVDYSGLKNDRQRLDQYLEILRSHHPRDDWSRDEQLAYWINAYNAFTLELILKHYPVEEIKDIGSVIQIPFVNTPWDIKFIEIEDKKYDLNNIEHDIIREQFNDPRIHFALVCASYSCPKLFREAFIAEKLDEQLEWAAVDFINDPRKNVISKEKAQLSKIFDWYGGDFKSKMALRDYVNQFASTKIKEDADLSYLDYDWSLNDQKKQP